MPACTGKPATTRLSQPHPPLSPCPTDAPCCRCPAGAGSGGRGGRRWQRRQGWAVAAAAAAWAARAAAAVTWAEETCHKLLEVPKFGERRRAAEPCSRPRTLLPGWRPLQRRSGFSSKMCDGGDAQTSEARHLRPQLSTSGRCHLGPALISKALRGHSVWAGASRLLHCLTASMLQVESFRSPSTRQGFPKFSCWPVPIPLAYGGTRFCAPSS